MVFSGDFPGSPVQEVWVRSLVKELRSHMLHGTAKKKRRKPDGLCISKEMVYLARADCTVWQHFHAAV